MTNGAFHDRHLLVIAFEGWNDAGEAATTAARLLRDSVDAIPLHVIESQDYFDYQFNRPMVARPDGGASQIVWPSAVFSGAEGGLRRRGRGDDFDAPRISFLIGTEPARAWRDFVDEVVDYSQLVGVTGVLILGAMLADVPHTRPVDVSVTSENEAVRAELGIERSSYEGPVGIVSVLAHAFEAIGIPAVSAWAALPHYAHQAPSPKATLALIDAVESLLRIAIPRGDLESDAREWEANVDALTGGDDELAGYIADLEQTRDAADAVEASGDAIAAQFARYLEEAGRSAESPIEPLDADAEDDLGPDQRDE